LTRKVLVLGGYGNFGKRISVALAASGVSTIIAGRDLPKAKALCAEIGAKAEPLQCDANAGLADVLHSLKPCAVVNTCGPFQTADYGVAQACIAQRVHYIDLADGRDFVNGITALDQAAKAQGVSVISGASTVPALSSAVVEQLKHEFARIDSLRFGISPGQKSERGLATTQGILTYLGKPLAAYPGHPRAFGWQDLHRQTYPELGKRWMANCDIPDLDLLPQHYGLKAVQFSAGMELSVVHLGLWGLSWLVRLGVPLKLAGHAGLLLRLSHLFDRFGTGNGGMHVIIAGEDKAGRALTRQWFIIARDGSGPHIPTVPARILARKLAQGAALPTGAYPCLARVTLEGYLMELKDLPISTHAW
jgi:hypothetical protein